MFDTLEATYLWHHLKKSGSSQSHQAFFCPDTILLAPFEHLWLPEALEFYMQHWNGLDYEIQLGLTQRLTYSILSFVELGRDIRSTTLASKCGLDFLQFLHNKICEKERFFKEDDAGYSNWRKVLRHMQHIRGLPHSYFRPVLGYFPPLLDDLCDLLNDRSTSLSVLGPVLDSYKQGWGDNCYKQWEKEQLISMLSTHITHAPHPLVPTILNPQPMNGDSSQASLCFPPSTSLVFSEQGLNFLIFINTKLINTPQLVYYCDDDTMQKWVNALDGIHNLCSFEPIPKYERWTMKDFRWWEAEKTHTGADRSSGIENGGTRSTDAPIFSNGSRPHTGSMAESMAAGEHEDADNNGSGAGKEAGPSSCNNEHPEDDAEAIKMGIVSQTSSDDEHHSHVDVHVIQGKGKKPQNHIRQQRKSKNEHDMVGGPGAEKNV
ncbi:hypothetical protein E1B28_000057 [Marasmius oreades]|uniref:Uncharacterized protein n=1 Tax=Marasmius oreades TaxID=181124 RepID=A0A9P8AE26_9AGAR|nr:uncharacterized protein E1B28_000057 [Marasmius oreades]KAG7098083.1 hypothetical protein E1B28_000057 [Marasmius oreades]